MAYLGGKAKGCEHILFFLNHPSVSNMKYVEPFVGYGHILRRVTNKSKYIASDVNELLITLLKSVQKSNRYPVITKEQYYKLKTAKNSVRKAFAAFCYSYNGKEFGGYVGDTEKINGRNYPKERCNYYDSLRNNKIFLNTELKCMGYQQHKPTKCLIYCDPPYIQTTTYGTINFDTNKFWNTMRQWSKNNIVLISEYKAPSDFKCISYSMKGVSVGGKGAQAPRQDCLFVHKSLLTKEPMKSMIKDYKKNTIGVK
jgi:DNA adenine methylase